jgi:LysM repeat protein
MALCVPLAIVMLAMARLPGTSLASPSSLIAVEARRVSTGDARRVATGDSRTVGTRDASKIGIGKRPAPSNPAPPPTLVPPVATPRPPATSAAADSSPGASTPRKSVTYTVRPGDELKGIAADYHVSIWKIIAANDIPNPDSLRIGQVLHIPSE